MATQTGNVLNSLSDPSQDFLVQDANDQILDVHAAMETLSDMTGINSSVHGLTSTGESVGFGKIGDSNLITDTAQAPGDILNGDAAPLVTSDIVTDAGNSVGDARTIVQGLGTDMANPDLVSNVVDGVSQEAGNVVDATPLTDNVGGLSNLGNLVNGGSDGSGQPIVSLGAGNTGGSPILDAGILNDAPGGSPIGIAAGSGDNLLNVGALSGDTGTGDTSGGSSGSLISAGAGNDGNPSILNAATLGGTNGDSPIDVAAGNGANIADVNALNGGTGNGTDSGSGDSLISAGAGNGDNPSLLSAAALGGTNGNSPIDVAAGNGANVADLNALNDNGSGHLITADGGAAGGNSLLDTGVLTAPDGQSPLNADVGNGTNIASAGVLPNSDVLQFPDLGGAGTDSLTGIVPSALGATDLASATGTDGSVPTASDAPLIDGHTDGGALVHVNPDPNALVGVNDHAIV